MPKVKLFEFANGKKGWAVGGIEIELGKKPPVAETELELDEELRVDFVTDPQNFEMSDDHKRVVVKDKEKLKGKENAKPKGN